MCIWASKQILGQRDKVDMGVEELRRRLSATPTEELEELEERQRQHVAARKAEETDEAA